MAVGKERREWLVRAERFCRVGPSGDVSGIPIENDMMICVEQSILEAQTCSAVEAPVW